MSSTVKLHSLTTIMNEAASRSKLCNPGFGLEQEKRIMARRKNKIDPDCLQPSDWLSSVELRKLPFYPQIGDEVMYFRQGHELYISTVKQRKLYEINPISLPWSKQMIRQQELVRIIDVTYEIKPPRLVCLTLGRLNPRNGASTKKRFIIKYHDMDEVPDFLVLKQDYDAAIKRQWTASKRFRSLMNNDCGVQMWWEGQFVKREPYNPQFPESMFLCFLIRWDNGDFDRLSPWDLENIDPRRRPLSVGASVRVLPIEITRTSYMPGIDDWPPVGNRESESDRISTGISQVMALDIAQPFSAPVDLDKFPTYAYVVKYPMDLLTIKTRLDHRFYRRAAAVEYDVRRIQTNAHLFNDPAKSNIVRNSCIITDLCLEIIRNGNADLADLSDQLLKRCKMIEISGNVQSSEISTLIQESSESLPHNSSFSGLKKKQPKAERRTEAGCFDFTLNSVTELKQTSIPAQVQDQKIIPKGNQVAKEHWPTEASFISLKGHVSPKLSPFVNVDGTKTGIGLPVDDKKSDNDSERKNTHFLEITTSKIKKKVIDVEEGKVECRPKLKQMALVSPYTFNRNNESVTINLQEKDTSTHVEDHTLSAVRNTSRRSRLPIQGIRTENLGAILLPEPTLSLFPVVSPSVNIGIGMSRGPQNRSDTYFGEESCCLESEITIASNIRKETMDSADRNIEYLSNRKKTSMSIDDLANLPRKEAHSQLPTFSPPNHTGIEVLTPPIDSYFQLATPNTSLELTGMREKERSSYTYCSTPIRSIPASHASPCMPLAVSTPIRMRNKEDVYTTNFAFGKPRLPRKNKENEINGQSVPCRLPSANPYCRKIRKKRRLSRFRVWDISLVEHVAQGSPGQKSPVLQKESSQPSHGNQLPMLETVTKDCPPPLNPFSKKPGEAPIPDCDLHANIYDPPEVQIASPISTLQDKSLYSAIMNIPTPVEPAINETPEANHQLKCNKSVFKENRNQATSAAKDKLLAKCPNQLDNEPNPTSSCFFPFRCEETKAPDSLLKKTLKKEHQVKSSTYKIHSGSKKDNSREQADDNRTDTTGLKDSSDPVSLSQDALIAEILAGSNLHVPIHKMNGDKSKSKKKKRKITGVSASSKVKKTRGPSDDCVSVEGIVKKCLPNESSHREPDDSKKGKMEHPKDHKKKRTDKLVLKGTMVYQHDVIVGGLSDKQQNKTRKRTRAHPSINEQLAFVERILQERN